MNFILYLYTKSLLIIYCLYRFHMFKLFRVNLYFLDKTTFKIPAFGYLM